MLPHLYLQEEYMDITVTKEIQDYSDEQIRRINEYLDNNHTDSLENYKNKASQSIVLINDKYLFVSTSLSDYLSDPTTPMRKVYILYVAKTVLGLTQEIVTGLYYDPPFLQLGVIGEHAVKIDEYYDKEIEHDLFKKCKVLETAIMLDDMNAFELLLDKFGNKHIYDIFMKHINQDREFVQYKSIIMKRMREIQDIEDFGL